MTGPGPGQRGDSGDEARGDGTATVSVVVDGRAEARRRFGRLPERIDAADMVESQPEPPPPEPGVDPHAQAIGRYGLTALL